MKAAIILGAGFSKNSGLPLESELARILTGPQDSRFDRCVSAILGKFLEDIFGYSKGKSFPRLEDIFTCLDLSTSSGHHLGIDYSPIHLGGIRRLLIYRLFSVLEEKCAFNNEVAELLKRLYGSFEVQGFVVLNWDTVLEDYLLSLFPDINIDYCSKVKSLDKIQRHSHETALIAKVHGSCSWLYCDNCRELFQDLYSPVRPLKKAGFHTTDLMIFDGLREALGENDSSACRCPDCNDVLASHISTLSYRKTFKANTFLDIWTKAEKILSGSDRWIFIGYSLPEADYEFKHMLKLAELKLAQNNSRFPEIDVILKSGGAVPAYESFFGRRIKRIFREGITEYLQTQGT